VHIEAELDQTGLVVEAIGVGLYLEVAHLAACQPEDREAAGLFLEPSAAEQLHNIIQSVAVVLIGMDEDHRAICSAGVNARLYELRD
jgi:hypothetical protein